MTDRILRDNWLHLKRFEECLDGGAKGKDPGNVRIVLEPGRV